MNDGSKTQYSPGAQPGRLLLSNPTQQLNVKSSRPHPSRSYYTAATLTVVNPHNNTIFLNKQRLSTTTKFEINISFDHSKSGKNCIKLFNLTNYIELYTVSTALLFILFYFIHRYTHDNINHSIVVIAATKKIDIA